MAAYVYILASKKGGTLYVGVTNHLARRITQHRVGTGAQFANKYRVRLLVYVEPYDNITTAIAREKQLKNWKRTWKIALIEQANPDWSDLFPAINR